MLFQRNCIERLTILSVKKDQLFYQLQLCQQETILQNNEIHQNSTIVKLENQSSELCLINVILNAI